MYSGTDYVKCTEYKKCTEYIKCTENEGGT